METCEAVVQVTDHALERYRQRIDRAGTAADLVARFAGAVPMTPLEVRLADLAQGDAYGDWAKRRPWAIHAQAGGVIFVCVTHAWREDTLVILTVYRNRSRPDERP